ncbi:MAG: tRNA pseudouridine(13) synthase TruD, partial [Methanomassiliicoccales archaeon]|nr:tRNA pseudouridine(13) synthase TruD [Methanomassiliicoccales archaeon]
TANRGVRIGDLIGNSFDIRVRNCTMPLSEIPSKVKKDLEIIKTVGGFPNYFGVQRFGTVRPITHIVGERIVRGDLKGAVMTYLSQQSEFEGEEINDIRRRFGSGESFEDIIPDMPKTMGFEKTMAEHLVRQPEDYIGAIAEMPGNLQMMFTHAYQSYMFNMMLSERMRRNIPLNEPILGDVVVPIDADGNAMHDDAIITTSKNIDLVKRQVTRGRAFVTITLFGTDSTFAEGEMGEIERNFIEKEGITERDFVVPGLPHCTSKGTRREIICPVRDLDFKMEDDGYSVRFSLPKGNYATCMMREILKSDMTDY